MRVEGPLVFNITPLMLKAALAGFGLACLFEDVVQAHLAEGRLVPGAGRLVPAVPGLSPLLPEPPPTHGSLRPACRRAPLLGLKQGIEFLWLE